MKSQNILTMPLESSGDVSNLLEMALNRLEYSREQIIHYTFLVEEALLKWRDAFPADAQLSFLRSDTSRNAVITLSVPGQKVDPFAEEQVADEDLPIRRMWDKLLSGVGSEIRYRYRKGRNMIRLSLPKKDADNAIFRRNIFLLMIPVAIQSMLENIASNIDTVMLGFLDSASMSAVSLSTQFAQIHVFLIDAFALAVTVLVAQYWGVRDRKRINDIAGVSMKVAMLFSAVFFVLSFFFPRALMTFYTNVPELIDKGVIYMRLLSFTFLITPIYRIAYCFLRTMGKVKECVRFAIAGCILNVLLNALFIFGLFGLPRLGIVGAGIATIASGLVQVICVFVYMSRTPDLHINFLSGRLIGNAMTGEFFTTAWPAVLQKVSWIVAINFITAAIGHMNASIVAAHSVFLIIFNLGLGLRSGASSAASILMGSLLGRNRLEEAKQKSRRLLRFSVGMSIAVGLLFAIVGYGIRFLNMDLNADTIRYMNVMLPFYSFNMCLAVFNEILNNGTLHAGGDTKSVLVIDLITMWGFLVPVALIGTYWVAIPEILFLFILKADELISLPMKYFRYRTFKWVRNLTDAKE